MKSSKLFDEYKGKSEDFHEGFRIAQEMISRQAYITVYHRIVWLKKRKPLCYKIKLAELRTVHNLLLEELGFKREPYKYKAGKGKKGAQN